MTDKSLYIYISMNGVVFAELAQARTCLSGLQWKAMLSILAEMSFFAVSRSLKALLDNACLTNTDNTVRKFLESEKLVFPASQSALAMAGRSCDFDLISKPAISATQGLGFSHELPYSTAVRELAQTKKATQEDWQALFIQ